MKCLKLISDANRQFSSQYGGDLANHLPMDLVALERLGASEERLHAYRDQYAKVLEPKLNSLGLEITAENWNKYLGQNKYHADYLKYFDHCLATSGLRHTLESHIPKLFGGVAGGAFHGLIRLGYALDSDNIEEVGQALGFWAVSYIDLGAKELAPGKKHPAEIFSELSAEFLGFRPEGNNIARRIQVIGQLNRFRQICTGLNYTETTYANIAQLALTLFAQTHDFTALHAVTATHVYRLVSKYCAASNDLLIGLAAAYVSIRAPKIHKIAPIQCQIEWKSLKEKAINSDDDHVPKIVYTCYEEYLEHGNSTYFTAASRYVELFA